MARPVCHRAAWRCASVSGVLHTPSPHQTHKPLTDCRRSAAEPTRAPSPQQHIHTQRTQPHRRQHLNQRQGLAWPGLVRSLSPSSRPKSHGSSITPMHALAWGISRFDHRHESQAQDYSTAPAQHKGTRRPSTRAGPVPLPAFQASHGFAPLRYRDCCTSGGFDVARWCACCPLCAGMSSEHRASPTWYVNTPARTAELPVKRLVVTVSNPFKLYRAPPRCRQPESSGA